MYIGIDLGGTNIAGGLVDISGNLLLSYSIPTEASKGYETVLANIVAVCRHLIEQAPKDNPPTAIGIGVPGLADDHSGIVYECVNLLWKEPHTLSSDVSTAVGLKVHISNDASVAAVAEFKKGALKGVRNGVLLTLGTGVGGGFIINGQSYSGSYGVGSEIGHMVVGVNDYTCNCGRVGCLETFASATAIIKYTQKRLREGAESAYLDSIGIQSEQIEAKHVIDGAKAGDELCTETFNRFIHYLVVGLVNTVVVLDPEIIALGGGVAKAGDFLIASIEKELDKHRVFRAAPSFKLALAEMGNDAGIIGAAMLCD